MRRMSHELSSQQFVGRADELGWLERTLASAAEGPAATVVVGGEAGVGKTRLVRELAARAAAGGALTLSGGCVDIGDGRLPFGPFVEALRTLVRDLDAAALDELFAIGRAELARLLPELGPVRAEADPSSASAQGRLF